jgi:hypothetical protein
MDSIRLNHMNNTLVFNYKKENNKSENKNDNKND